MERQRVHNVSFLFNYAQPTPFSPSSRSGVFGYTEIMDTERVRGWRFVLDPGQTAAPFKQTAPVLRIVLGGGKSPKSSQANRTAA